MTATKTRLSTMDTPAGPFTALVDADGAVLASGFTTDEGALLPLVHPSLRGTSAPHRTADLGLVTKAVAAYLAGDLTSLDQVPVRQRTTGDFLGHAWQVLRTVPAGSPVSYTAFAALAGRPAAVRAAAQACARNAAALFVPCHRVLRGDGSLGGFRWGVEVKRWLLSHEQAATIERPPASSVATGSPVATGSSARAGSPAQARNAVQAGLFEIARFETATAGIRRQME